MASSVALTFFLLSLFLSPSLSEIETHLHFYFHDIVSGSNPTAIKVAESSSSTNQNSPTGFGTIVMIDDALTQDPHPSSMIIGRAQGMYTVAAQEEAGLLMAMSFVFIEGEYSNSTLSLLGRNAVLSDVREMPIVGGTGMFRLARGYALARTYDLDASTGNAVVEYDVHVMHI